MGGELGVTEVFASLQPAEKLDVMRSVRSRVGSTLYVNEPQTGADQLNDFDALLNRWAGPQLCRTDSLQLLDRTSRIPSGFVVLGDFVPYKKAPAAAKNSRSPTFATAARRSLSALRRSDRRKARRRSG